MNLVFPDVTAHSVSRLLVHIVWATRGRQLAIDAMLDEPLERALLGKARELRAAVHAFGAALDHVHVLVQLPADVSVAVVVQRLKGATSHAFRRSLLGGWQVGYWAESVSPEAIQAIALYVRAQRVHHESGVQDEPWQMEPAGRRA
jgi:REP element-mobilizing transposase RayT